MKLAVVGVALVAAFKLYPADPPSRDAVPPNPLQARVDRLERDKAKLTRKLGREQRANRFHARQVRRLRAALRARVALGPSGVVAGFFCVHGHEGAWDDPNPPYFGGIQMDLDFQRTYGANFLKALGTANHWPPFVQIAVGMNAFYSGRGWHPWPNTARACGLL